MGCDIHLFVEHKRKNEDEWRSVSCGQFSISRDYLLFGCLAKGVRCSIDDAIPPKGIPNDISTWGYTWDDIYLWIREKASEEYNSCTEEQAGRWGNPIFKLSSGDLYTLNPDRHSHSWLSLSELNAALELYVVNSQTGHTPYIMKGIASMMEVIESAQNYTTRIVFSFDN